MRILVLRRLLIVLTGLAFLAGAAVQAMPRAELMAPACMGAAKTATGNCCAKMAMKDHAAPSPIKQVPCKDISLDCANQLGCISSPALPASSIALGSPTAYGRVAYWPPPTSRCRAVDQTRPLPPYSEPHNRLIEPDRAACARLWSASGCIQRGFESHVSLQLTPILGRRLFPCRRVSSRAPPRLPLFLPPA